MKKTYKYIIFGAAILLIISKMFMKKEEPKERAELGERTDEKRIGVPKTATQLKKASKTPKGLDFSPMAIQNALEKVQSVFGDEMAGIVEQLYRKETRNFDSLQFKKTLSAGMEIAKGKTQFPWGWGSLTKFVNEYPEYKGGYFTVPMIENNTGKTKTFIGFPSLEAAMMSLAYILSKRKHAGYWRSTDPAIADRYYASLKTYPIKFT